MMIYAENDPGIREIGPVTGEMKTSDVLDRYPVAMEIFTEHGMLCMDCVCSEEETVAESCQVHCMDADAVIDLINRKIRESADNN